jgi:hypothetical protein
LPRVEENLSFDLRLLGHTGLSWIYRQLDRIRPADFSNNSALKDVTELGILYSLLFRWSEDRSAPLMRSIRAFLLEVCDDPALSHLARRSPAAYTSFFILYLALRATGIALPHFDSAYRMAERLGYPAALEMLPFRRIEIEYFAWKSGLRSQPVAWERWLPDSTLARAENPIYLATMEAYSITNTLFYLTDFAGPSDGLPPDLARKATAMTECLLVHFWRQADWDLTGELLLNAVALSLHRTPLFHDAFNALARAWRPDGVLPGPYSSKSDDAAADFKNSFHTTLVGLLLVHAYEFRLRQEASA